jgi:hypothetical protein
VDEPFTKDRKHARTVLTETTELNPKPPTSPSACRIKRLHVQHQQSAMRTRFSMALQNPHSNVSHTAIIPTSLIPDAISKEEDWSGKPSSERRKLQNRLNQRARRKCLRYTHTNSESNSCKVGERSRRQTSERLHRTYFPRTWN